MASQQWEKQTRYSKARQCCTSVDTETRSHVEGKELYNMQISLCESQGAVGGGGENPNHIEQAQV